MNDNPAAVRSHESHAVHILLASLIDYAGLFPPSALAMKEAVANFSHHRAGQHAWMLGRFIVPASRLAEFESELPSSRYGSGWHVSALISANVRDEIEAIIAFNKRHLGMATIDSIEVKVSLPEDVANLRKLIPDSFLAYCELPSEGEPRSFLSAIRAARARAKIRTGGVKPEMFPASGQVVRFIRACVDTKVPFKATAGLHHPVRCVRPLTYAVDAPSGTMHGFLNVFLAAAFAQAGLPEEQLVELMNEESPDAIKFDAKGVRWREQHLDNTQLLECRAGFAMSFGSCSVDEPIEDLRSISLL